MTTAIFPGTFDPFTIGHFDVLQRALRVFDRIIIAVNDNQNKKTLFTTGERAAMIQQAVQPFAGAVTVSIYDCLTVDFCGRHHVKVIVRGIRTAADYNLESVMAQANHQLAPDIDTIFFPSLPEHTCISSSIVRDILLHRGDVSAFIPKGMEIIHKN
jgi:pantetheine-phosphate adenylyltransferase